MGVTVLLLSERLEVLLGSKWVLEASGLCVHAAENSAEAEAVLCASPNDFGLVLVARPLILGSVAEIAKAGLPVVGFSISAEDGAAPGAEATAAEEEGAFCESLPPGLPDPEVLVRKYGLATSSQKPGWQGAYNPVAIRGKRVLQLSSADADVDTQRFIRTVLGAEGLAVEAASEAPTKASSYDVLLTTCSEEGLRAVRHASGLPVVVYNNSSASSDLEEAFREAGVERVLPYPLRQAALIEGIYRATNPTNVPIASELEAKVREPPLDLSDLLEQFEGDWEFLRDLLTCFLEEGVTRMQKLLEATAAGNVADIKFVSHTMKGSSRSCCLMDIGNLFADLETLSGSKLKPASSNAEAQVMQSISLLASLSQQSFLQVMDFDYRLQNIKVLDVPAGLEACEGNWELLSSELLIALRSGLAAVKKQDSAFVSAVITPPTVEHVSAEVYNAAMDVLEFGEESFPAFEVAIRKLQSDLCLLLGRKALE